MHKSGSSVLLFVAVTVIACDGSSSSSITASAPAIGVAATAAANENSSDDRGDVRIVTATGDITSSVNEFRSLLGALNPNVAGEQPGGRREINWDGVPAALTNNDLLPGNFFNVNSPRGVVMSTDGSGFRVSSNGYVDVNAAYEGEFNVFSPTKLFVARGSTVTDIRFFVAGSNTPALVTGFGSVFADVGRSYSTTIEYFDAAGTRLLEIKAPRRSDKTGLSFAGAVFASASVARVRITSGDTPIAADVVDNVRGAGKKRDIVAMDDFIYGEPRAGSR